MDMRELRSVLVLLSALEVWAQPADPGEIAEMGRLYRQKGNCLACHGRAGARRLQLTDLPAPITGNRFTCGVSIFEHHRKGIDAKCAEYWGSDVERYKDFPN